MAYSNNMPSLGELWFDARVRAVGFDQAYAELDESWKEIVKSLDDEPEAAEAE